MGWPAFEQTARTIRVGALTRYRRARARQRLLVIACCRLIRRSAAAHRASADPQPRHDRRQPCARRSGVRASGARRRHGGADAAQVVRRRAAMDRGRRTFSGPAHHRYRSPTRCWSTSNCRSPKPRERLPASWRWRAAAAILPSPAVAAIVTLDARTLRTDVRLALCGVGETPVDASEAVAFLVGQPCTTRR